MPETAPVTATFAPDDRWDPAAQAMYRAAQTVARAAGPALFDEVVAELTTTLGVPVAFVATLADAATMQMRTLAVRLDGRRLQDFEFPLHSSPCAKVVGHGFRHVVRGVAVEFPPGSIFAAKAMDSYAAFPMTGHDGAPLGLIAVMDRVPIADPALAEALLKIFAVRVAAEIEQRRATEALRRSEASYRAIFEAAEDAIFVHDWATGAIVDANPKACAIYGFERDELLRLPVEALSSGVPPYDAEHALQYIDQARRGHCPPFEWHRRNKDGSLHWDEVRLKAVRIDDRPYVLAFTREVTAHKEALAALRQSEQQYRAIFDGSADSMGLWDEQLRLVDVNHAFTRLSGWTRAEALGRRLDERPGEPDVARRIELIRGALGGREGRVEALVPGVGGRRFDVEVRYVPVRFGGRDYALSVARDITERNAALAALRAQEQKYRTIFDGTIDSMVLWSSELRVVDVNAAFVQMTGLAREQVVGRLWSERPDADDLPQLLALIEGALQGEVGQATLNVSRADGSRFDIELRYLPVRIGDEAYALGVGRDVSERLERERRLSDSEEQYRAIFNASADALVLRDAAFRIIDVNATYERMSGWSRAEVLGLDRVVANPAEVAPEIRALHERALAGETVALEVPLLRRDGVRYEIELRGVPIRHRGRPHVLYMGRDVTEREQAEQALRESEEQYRVMFNASADALMLWNSRLQRVDINPAHERIFGYAREELIGRAFEGLGYPEEMVRPRMEMLRRALAGEASRAELEALRKDGRRIVTELRAVPVQYRGEPHVLQIARDITESRSAEARLRASEEQYRAIFDASVDALILWNSRFQRVDVNPAYERIFGWRRDEVIGRGYDQPQFTAAYATPRRELVQRALDGEACSAELDSLRKDGTSIRVDVHVIPFQHLGEPHVLAIVRDVTERRAAEAEREQLEAQLRQAQKMEAIGQLTGGIAHDFNNILTSVIGYLVLAEERAAALGDERLPRQLGKAQLAAQRARDLIAQMLAFARRQRGERHVLALAPLVRQTLQLLRATLPTSVAVDAALPADADGPWVDADSVQLEQVLFNLCINARDAVGETGVIRVRLGTAGGAFTCASCRAAVPAGERVELRVADDGCGIAPQAIERIFEPFFSTKEVGQGSGMGLAMVHGIVHDHGGHIELHSQPGAGSVFRVLLPPAPAPAGAPGEGAPAGARGSAPAALHGRVLVVDDEPMVGEFMGELLESWGLEVQVETAPLAALALLQDPAQRVDLLITDQTMPQLTGLALARRATALRPGLAVLLYTGQAEPIDAATLQAHGVRALLPKPVDAEALRARLAQWLTAPSPC